MAGWLPLPSSLQKRFLSYALSRTGIFDETVLDLDKLNLTWGRQNVVELHDVALSIPGISKLIDLPPELRLTAAKALSLRLTVPADILHSNIIFELDGINVDAVHEQRASPAEKESSHSERKSQHVQSPAHRKTTRRIPSPHGVAWRGLRDAHATPTVHDMARSFLMGKSPEERQQLEESVAVHAQPLDDSLSSLSSDVSAVGTGAAFALPGFLEAFLRGVMDRVKVNTKNISVLLTLHGSKMSVGLHLSVNEIRAWSEPATPSGTTATSADTASPPSAERHVEIADVTIELLHHHADLLSSALAHDGALRSPDSLRETFRSTTSASSASSHIQSAALDRSGTSSITTSAQSLPHRHATSSPQTTRSQDSMLTTEAERFADVDDATVQESQLLGTELDIWPGDDNISWGTRKTQTGANSQDMWDTTADDDDLPDSLLFDSRLPIPAPRAQLAESDHQYDPPVSQLQTSFESFNGQAVLSQLQAPSVVDDVFADPVASVHQHDNLERLVDSQSQSDHSLLYSAKGSEVLDAEPASSPAERQFQPGHNAADGSEALTAHEHATEDAFYQPEQSQTISDLGATMYMSTVTHDSPKSVAKSRVDMPGAWASEMHDPTTSVSRSVVDPEQDESQARTPLMRTTSVVEEPAVGENSGANTPKALSPVSAPHTSFAQPRHVFECTTTLLELDHVRLSLQSPSTVSSPSSSTDIQHAKDSLRTHSMTLSDTTTSQISRHDSQLHHGHEEPTATSKTKASVKLGSLHSDVDIPTLQLLHALSSHMVRSDKPTQGSSPKTTDSTTELSVRLNMRQIKLVIRPGLKSVTHSDLPGSGPSIELRLSSHVAHTDLHHTAISIGKVCLLSNGLPLVSFQKEQQIETVVHVPSHPDLEMVYSTVKTDTRGRTVPEIDIKTQVLKLSLHANELIDASNNWGGLSGLLDLRNSTQSDPVIFSPPTLKKQGSGVHFEGDAPPSASSIQTKVNIRIAGCHVDVTGQTSGIALRTTSIRVIHREQASSASASQVRLEAPVSSSAASSVVTLDNVRFDLLNTPQDKDLDRFLALLTPSKDKYENDEDILLDTLLRQRKKGSCLRITAESLDVQVAELASLLGLQSLASEFGQLSAVAKYLPDDDRPGLLSMIRIKAASCQIPTDKKLGVLRLAASELQCAHVGLPALLACAVSDLTLGTSTGISLVHPLLPLIGAENLPMIMVRMVGDEYDPTIQIKLHNICAEYSVPTLLGLLDENALDTTGQILEDLSQSVADLALSHPQHLASQQSPTNVETRHRVKLSVLVRHSGIGLQPQKLQAKALLVLTDMKISALVPPDPTMKVTTGIRRAGLFIVDRLPMTSDQLVQSPRRVVANTATDARLAHALHKQGYVSIGSIMSANIDVVIHDSVDGGTKRTEVDVQNELLLLETCADSTQTMLAILGDLAPPTPPSSQDKYLTQPMSLEEMLASFTGETVVKAEQNEAETLFDAELGSESDQDMFMEASELLNNADDLLLESEMTSSLYGPVSGLIGDVFEESEETRPPTEAAESLLEEDPFVMTVTPEDLPFSDVTLLKDLRQQFRPSASDEAVDLGIYEIEDLGFDALGPEMHVLGQRHRFNAPVPTPGRPRQRSVSEQIALCVRLRDTNFIWNIHDGYDWQKTQDGITSAVEQIEQRAEERTARRRSSRPDQDEEESVIGDFLFNSIYIGVPSNVEAQDIRRQINRHIDDMVSETESARTRLTAGTDRAHRPRRKLKLDRSRSHKIAFELKGLFVDFNALPPDSPGEVQSNVDVRIKSFEIFDNVPTSTWRKFLTQLPPADGTREMSRPMLHLELSNVRTIRDHAATEMILNVTLTPLRLHVDQDALDFITRFFEFKDDSARSETPSDQPFLQRVEVQTVDLRLDYKPKKVDYAGLRSGHTTEFMNFVILDAANIKLKHAIVYGIKGFEPLHKTLNDVWMPDVRRNQLPTVLAGLAPVRSLVNIGSGVRDVVAIPVREYKKDGRIVRSIQKGAFHFGKTTASELARLGAKVAIGTQNVLSGAEGLLSPSPARSRPSSRQVSHEGWHDMVDEDEAREQRAISAYADQPLGVLAGLQSARRFLEHDLLTARDAFIAVQGEVLSSDNPGAAAAAIVRHAPTVILRPVIGASRAVGTALLGVGNQIDRDNLTRIDDKYKRR